MNIGFVSTRLAGVDGVSLETAKLVTILRRLGHVCFYCAGELDAAAPPGRLVPEMHFAHPTAQALHDEAFGTPQPTRDLFMRLFAQADHLRSELETFIREYQIDVLITQNANAIPMQLALGVAIRDLAERTRISTICHNHDFYWERERFLNNGIRDILDTAFPPKLDTVRHLVINKIAQQELRARRGLEAAYLPNVFDFAHSPAPPDAYAQSFPEAVGLRDDDIVLLQPTRVIRRKAIEKAIELVRKLADERIILLITGYEGDEPGGYGDWLREEADRAGIRYRFIADLVGAERSEQNGQRVYTLWDIYPHADLITYPSVYEGFGNALIETVYFRKPLIVHTYAMYQSDIRPAGIQAVEFNYDITPAVVKQVRQLLDDADLRDKLVEHNYAVGRQHFSYEVAEAVLQNVLASF
jgi:mannosylglucosylglycerate synthase